MAKEDCAGGPVVSDSSVVVRRDECGVCGGTGDTCVDCQGTPNGGEIQGVVQSNRIGIAVTITSFHFI